MSSYVTRYIHPDRSCPHSECHGREDVSDSGISTSTSFDHDRKILRTCLYRVLTGMSAYDLLESSVGIAVLEVNVTLDVAFLAAIETNTSYCPLWDSKKNLFVGALSSSDYLKIVLHAYDAYIRGDVTILDRLRFMSIEEFSRQKWAGTTYTTVPCITANIDEDNAVTIFQKLFMHRIHHIPLIASASTQPTICGVLTYQPLMIAIADILVNLNQKVNVLELSMENLKIGTYGNHETLHVITMESKLELAFRIFLEHGVHILPVVNTEGVVLAVLSRSDLLSLEPATGCIDLSMCVQDILPERTKGEVNDIFVYHNHDTLRSVITHILWCGIRSLVAVDMQNRLTGMCSVGDLARFVYEVLFGDEPA